MEFLRPKPECIPDELKSLDQWVVWRAEKRGEKITKVPYNPLSLKHAKSTDPMTWTGFDKAWKVFRGGNFNGIGFVLSKNDEFSGVDLDHCRDLKSGVIDDWAMKIAKELNSYTEISPSGTGLRIFIKGKLPEGRRKKGDIEMYEDGRYLTVTGHVI